MTTVSTNLQSIEYPESDGRPMGETDWHIHWTLRLRELLKFRYREQRVYVASDLLLYYHEGVPRDFVVPDGFVVLDCDPKWRRIFKTWEEQRVPAAVFEFTSASTKRQDEFFKPRIYAEIGVQEYFIFDPHGEYLSPPLQGFRLDLNGDYQMMAPNAGGQLECRSLGLTLEIFNDDLRLSDLQTGRPLLTQAEESDRRAEENAKRAEANARRVKEVESQNLTLQAELRQLKEELKRHDRL